MDSVTITTTLDGRALQRGLSRLPALRAPEEAWCELAECLKEMADKLLD